MSVYNIFGIVIFVLLATALLLTIIIKPSDISKKTIWYFIPVYLTLFISRFLVCQSDNLFYRIVQAIITGVKTFGFDISSDILAFNEHKIFVAASITSALFASLTTVLVVLVAFFKQIKSRFVFLFLRRNSADVFTAVIGEDSKAIELYDSSEKNTILFVSNDNSKKRVSLKNNKCYFSTSNIDKIVKKLKSFTNLNVAVAFCDQAKSIAFIDGCNDKLSKETDFYTLSDGYLVKVDKENPTSNVLIEPTKYLSDKLFYDVHLYEYLPKGFINYDNAIIDDGHTLKYFIIGCTDVNYNNLVNLISNYRTYKRKLEINVVGQKTKEAKDFVDKFYFEYSAIKEYLKIKEEDESKKDRLYYELDSLDIEIVPFPFGLNDFKLYDLFGNNNTFNYCFIDINDNPAAYAFKLSNVLNNKGIDHLILLKSDKKICTNNDKIFTYGSSSVSLSKAVATDDDIYLLAKNINYNYCLKNGTTLSIDEEWNKLTYMLKESNRCAAVNLYVKLNLLGYTLKSDGEDNSGEINNLIISDGTISELEKNLAMLEHSRWNIFELLNGVLPLTKEETFANKKYNSKNSSRTKHANILSYNGLLELEKDLKHYQDKAYAVSNSDLRLIEKDIDGIKEVIKLAEKANLKIVKL